MSKEFQKFLMYGRKLWKRRWLILVTTVVICIIGWPYVLMLPNEYQVTAKVYLDTQTILKPLLEGIAVNNPTMEQTAMVLRRTLLNRTNMEKVARKTDLDLKTRTPEDFERILVSLAKKIDMQGDLNEKIYTISYQGKDPKRAKHVVEELLNLFVEGALGESRLDTTSTQQFLNNQINEYESKLEASENLLKEFKRKNAGLMPDEGQTYFSQRTTAIEQLNVARLALEEAVNRRNELKNQIANFKEAGEIPSSPKISPLQSRLNELLLNYTDQHPDVIALKRVIAEHAGSAVIEPEGEKIDAQSSFRLYGNLAYQELKTALGKTEAEIAALKVRVKQREAKTTYLQKMVDTMPEVEAELVKLNRDYNIIKNNYEEMVKRRERAKITQEAEQSTDNIQFKIVEPPRVPLLPVGPDRHLLLTATLALGTGTGLGLALLLIQLRPTFGNWQDLREATSLPIFGSVSLIYSTNQRAKARLQTTAFWSVLLVLVTCFFSLHGMQVLNITPTDILNAMKQQGLL